MKHIIRFDPSLKGNLPPKPLKLRPKSNVILQALENKSIPLHEFISLCSEDEVLRNLAICDHSLEFLHTIGLDISLINQEVFLGSLKRSLKDQIFCFVDIESSGADPRISQILEIGAIKYCNGKVLDRFESYVRASNVPEIIQEITGITPEALCDAPQEKEVLQSFRKFLGDSIFVAHNVGFDYTFLDYCYCRFFGVGLYNQKLCTIELAKRSIVAPRYGLNFLNNFLEIHTPQVHRAYADAYTCMRIFEKSLKNVDACFFSAQSLLNFSQKAKSLKNLDENS
ncbi:3'-5' exonuclease [Helicobacter cholecystus]|uniref:3'-5' exonuclease n=1 Tax=Helicobacter cholecystus TaxID=45498 RepID=UPI000F6D510B|nr:3'-5' exonuclease [Helicobacter cholecystus]VEJ24320.1 DNA polymerase III subunit epsilon [Helicobacter cholecystus]